MRAAEDASGGSVIVFRDQLYAVLGRNLAVMVDGRLELVPQAFVTGVRGITELLPLVGRMREAFDEVNRIADYRLTPGIVDKTIGRLFAVVASETSNCLPIWSASVMETYRLRAEAAEAELAKLRGE